MKPKKSSPTVKLVLRVPPDVRAWLLKRAALNAGTMGTEVSRAVRDAMRNTEDRRAAAE